VLAGAVVAATKTVSTKNGLTALTSAALALPGIAISTSVSASDAGYRVDEATVSVNSAYYSESGDRMAVSADQINISYPIGDNYQGFFSATRDITSGASPVANVLDLNGNPHLLLHSGASIEDRRDILDASIGHYKDNSYIGISAGKSVEDDYVSNYGSISYRVDFLSKTTTLQFNAAFANDEVWNAFDSKVLIIDPTTYHTRKKRDALIGISQIVDKNTVVKFNLGYSHQTGFLSDPYKKSFIVDEAIGDFRGIISIAGAFQLFQDSGIIDTIEELNLVEPINLLINVSEVTEFLLGLPLESRPQRRDQWIGLFRLSRFLPSTNSAIHLDYRFIDDSWNTNSQTLDIKWNFTLPYNWQLSPSVRYYSQHSAFFYDIFFEDNPSSLILLNFNYTSTLDKYIEGLNNNIKV